MFWRAAFVVPSLLIILEALISLLIFPKVNSLTYLVLVRGEKKALFTLGCYFEQKTARYLVENFQENRLAVERRNKEYLNSETRNGDGMDLSQAVRDKKSKGLLVDKIKQKNNKVGVFWTSLKAYSTEVVHIIVFSVTSILSFNETFYQFSVYYGANNLNNKYAVTRTKQFVLYSSIMKLVSCFIIGGLNWTKKRKASLIISHLSTLVLLTAIAFGYYIENLEIGRYCLVLAPITTVGLYSVNDIYSNDLCPPSLYSINHMLVRGIPSLFALLVPLYIHFEILSYQEVAIRLMSLVLVGVVCFIWLAVKMIETDGLDRKVIRARLKGL